MNEGKSGKGIEIIVVEEVSKDNQTASLPISLEHVNKLNKILEENPGDNDRRSRIKECFGEL